MGGGASGTPPAVTPTVAPGVAPGVAGPTAPALGGVAPAGGIEATPADSSAAAVPGEGPTGPGWIIQLTGYHYHNLTSAPGAQGGQFLQGAQYVNETLIKGLEGSDMMVLLPVTGEDGQTQTKPVPLQELGISHPVLIKPGRPYPSQVVNPNVEGAIGAPGVMGGPTYGMYEDEGAGPMGGYPGAGYGRSRAAAEGEEKEDPMIDVMKFDFTVQFAWQPRSTGEEQEEVQSTEQQNEVQP